MSCFHSALLFWGSGSSARHSGARAGVREAIWYFVFLHVACIIHRDPFNAQSETSDPISAFCSPYPFATYVHQIHSFNMTDVGDSPDMTCAAVHISRISQPYRPSGLKVRRCP